MKTTTLFVMVLFFVLITSVSATWCDTDYAKRINVSVNNTGGGALTDYQVYVNLSSNPINETSLRVYNSSDCTLRPHWTENETGGNSYGVWINYSAIAASAWTNNTAIYYDNVAASSASNGTTTFEFFDDFSEAWEDVEIGSTGSTWSRVRNIDIKGNYAYVTTNGYFRVISISDPTNPSQVASIAISDDLCECKISGNYAYITNAWNLGDHRKIHIINITNPLTPSIESTLQDNTYLIDAHDGWIDGDYFYVCCYTDDRLTIVNVSNKTNPTIQGSIKDTVKLAGAHDVLIEGNYAYVAVHWGNTQNEGSFTVVNISNKSNPVIISSIQHADLRGGAGMCKKDNYVYVGACPNAGAHSGERLLVTIDVSDVNSPTIGTIVNDIYMYRGRIEGDYLWIASGGDTDFAKYDISTPSTPSKIAEKQYTGDGTYDLAISGDYLYGTKRNGVSFVVLLKSLVGPQSEKWNISGATGSWSSYINTLKATGTGTSLLKAKYTVPSTYIMEMKVKKPDDTNIYGYPKYIDNDNFVGGVLAGLTHAYRNFYVQENNVWTTDDRDTVNWDWNTWYKWKLQDGPSGTYEFTTEKLDGSDANTMNNVDSVGFSGNLSLAIYNGEGYFDDVFVRNYASPEPATTLGSEEQQGANPILHIGNTINVKEDWGRDFNSNLSANVTVANASDVWMNFSNAEFSNTSLGDLNLSIDEWVNESHNVNSPVTNVSVNVYLNSTTSGATNDTDSFWYEVTKRTNTATMGSAATQSVDTSETFYVNATCNEEYGDTFLGAANLLEDGAIIDTNSSVTNYVNFSHSESSIGQYNYTIRFYNLTHYDNATTPTYSNVTVFGVVYIPPDPINLANTTGNFWVNHTWSAGTPGNVTDSFNVSVFPGWYNTTLNTYYNDSGLTPHDWNNVTVYAYNSSGNGSLSVGSVSDDVQIPNNLPVLSGLPDNTTDEDVNQTDIFDLDDYFTDADGDTPTYLVESNNQSAYVSVTINVSNNVSYMLASGWNGTASVVINATDGWGGEDNDTFLIIVNAAPLPGDYTPGDPTTLQNTTGNYWVNYTWNSGAGNITDSYNVSWNMTWYNNTLVPYMNDSVGEFGWANISVWAYNSTGNGSLSAGSISGDTQAGGGTYTTPMGTTAYNLITYYGSATSTAEQFGLDIGDVGYVCIYNGSFYTHTMGFSANNFTTYHGIGYYVYLNASGSSTYQRNNIPEVSYNTQLFNRWNTIGWTNSTNTNAEGIATSIGSACKYTSMLNADGVTYTTHTVGFTSNNHAVDKGKGYWVWTNTGVNWGRNS